MSLPECHLPLTSQPPRVMNRPSPWGRPFSNWPSKDQPLPKCSTPAPSFAPCTKPPSQQAHRLSLPVKSRQSIDRSLNSTDLLQSSPLPWYLPSRQSPSQWLRGLVVKNRSDLDLEQEYQLQLRECPLSTRKALGRYSRGRVEDACRSDCMTEQRWCWSVLARKEGCSVLPQTSLSALVLLLNQGRGAAGDSNRKRAEGELGLMLQKSGLGAMTQIQSRWMLLIQICFRKDWLGLRLYFENYSNRYFQAGAGRSTLQVIQVDFREAAGGKVGGRERGTILRGWLLKSRASTDSGVAGVGLSISLRGCQRAGYSGRRKPMVLCSLAQSKEGRQSLWRGQRRQAWRRHMPREKVSWAWSPGKGQWLSWGREERQALSREGFSLWRRSPGLSSLAVAARVIVFPDIFEWDQPRPLRKTSPSSSSFSILPSCVSEKGFCLFARRTISSSRVAWYDSRQSSTVREPEQRLPQVVSRAPVRLSRCGEVCWIQNCQPWKRSSSWEEGQCASQAEPAAQRATVLDSGPGSFPIINGWLERRDNYDSSRLVAVGGEDLAVGEERGVEVALAGLPRPPGGKVAHHGGLAQVLLAAHALELGRGPAEVALLLPHHPDQLLESELQELQGLLDVRLEGLQLQQVVDLAEAALGAEVLGAELLDRQLLVDPQLEGPQLLEVGERVLPELAGEVLVAVLPYLPQHLEDHLPEVLLVLGCAALLVLVARQPPLHDAQVLLQGLEALVQPEVDGPGVVLVAAAPGVPALLQLDQLVHLYLQLHQVDLALLRPPARPRLPLLVLALAVALLHHRHQPGHPRVHELLEHALQLVPVQLAHLHLPHRLQQAVALYLHLLALAREDSELAARDRHLLAQFLDFGALDLALDGHLDLLVLRPQVLQGILHVLEPLALDLEFLEGVLLETGHLGNSRLLLRQPQSQAALGLLQLPQLLPQSGSHILLRLSELVDPAVLAGHHLLGLVGVPADLGLKQLDLLLLCAQPAQDGSEVVPQRLLVDFESEGVSGDDALKQGVIHQLTMNESQVTRRRKAIFQEQLPPAFLTLLEEQLALLSRQFELRIRAVAEESTLLLALLLKAQSGVEALHIRLGAIEHSLEDLGQRTRARLDRLEDQVGRLRDRLGSSETLLDQLEVRVFRVELGQEDSLREVRELKDKRFTLECAQLYQLEAAVQSLALRLKRSLQPRLEICAPATARPCPPATNRPCQSAAAFTVVSRTKAASCSQISRPTRRAEPEEDIPVQRRETKAQRKVEQFVDIEIPKAAPRRKSAVIKEPLKERQVIEVHVDNQQNKCTQKLFKKVRKLEEKLRETQGRQMQLQAEHRTCKPAPAQKQVVTKKVRREVEVPKQVVVEVEVERLVEKQVVKEVPGPVKWVDRVVQKPVFNTVKRIVESEVLVEKEVLETVEVPVEKVVFVDKVVETPFERVVYVDKQVEVEEPFYVDRPNYVPVEVPYERQVPVRREVPYEVVREVPVPIRRETPVDIPSLEMLGMPMERRVEVPRERVREVRREVPYEVEVPFQVEVPIEVPEYYDQVVEKEIDLGQKYKPLALQLRRENGSLLTR